MHTTSKPHDTSHWTNPIAKKQSNYHRIPPNNTNCSPKTNIHIIQHTTSNPQNPQHSPLRKNAQRTHTHTHLQKSNSKLHKPKSMYKKFQRRRIQKCNNTHTKSNQIKSTSHYIILAYTYTQNTYFKSHLMQKFKNSQIQ